MNLFEKIFNYQLLSRLQDTGTFMVTAQERAWLKTVLKQPAAQDALSEETLEKLQRLLTQEDALDLTEVFVEKAKSREKQVVHPWLRILRRLINRNHGLRLIYTVRDGRTFTGEPGLPYKLEYSMVKKEWYLLWYHLRHRSLMSTRLEKIAEVEELNVTADRAERIAADIERLLEKRTEHAAVEVVQQYHRELSRILYAFSCFEKKVEYDADEGRYVIRLTFLSNESEFVLSKLRFLGKRVKVVEGEYLRRRMAETARKALARYVVQEAPAGADQ